MRALQAVRSIDAEIARSIAVCEDKKESPEYLQALQDVRQYVLKVQEKILKSNDNYFTELATRLREMWPPGTKDGKFAWRDSVDNLVTRLQNLWDIRDLKDYPIEFCLQVARRYLSKFENDTKYMCTLKYFILKQKHITQKDGSLKYISESKFADMLEGQDEKDAVMNEIEQMFATNTFGEGTIR